MKTKITALLLAVAATFALVPQTAHAGDKEAALIGGLIGGFILGAAIQDAGRPAYTETVVVHDAPTTVVAYGDRGACEPAGYWDYRTVRVWIPAAYEVRYVRGCRERVYVPGYWTHRRERVWVAVRDHDHRGRDRRW